MTLEFRADGEDAGPEGHPDGRRPPRAAPGGRRVGGHGAVLVSAWLVLAGVLMLCGAGIERSPAILSLDASITTFLAEHRTPGLNRFMTALTWTGSWLAGIGLAVVLVALTRTHRLRVAAVGVVLAAWVGEQLAVTSTKTVVQRPRPPEAVRLVETHGWSFPSGHTANTVVIFATVAALVTTFWHGRTVRVVTWVLCTAVTALVGFSRIVLGAHWTTDVAVSAVWTACWLLLVGRIVRSRDRPGDRGPSASFLD